MRFVPRTILGQLITGSVLVQTVVFGAFFWLSIRHDFRDMRQHDRLRLMQQTGTIADILAEPLATSNVDMLDHIMRAVPISITISSIRVTDSRGKTVRTTGTGLAATLNRQERSLLPELLQHTGYHLEQGAGGTDQGVQAIVADGAVLGIVWITPDTSVTRLFPLKDLENLTTYAICALLGNLLLVWWLSASMAQPLRHLRLATQRVRNNPNDLSAFPLPAIAQNEVGELQASFNAMVNEIALQRRGTQQTLKLLDSMLDSAPVGFAFFDRNYRFVRLNQNLAHLNGVPLQHHLGKRYRDLLLPRASTDLADETEDLLAYVFRNRTAITDHEISGATPRGNELRTWQTTLFPVVTADDEVRWAGIIVTDITERKRAEEAMRRSERLASAGRLAASIAHEINNPLESVTNLLYLLRTSTSLNEEAQEYVAMAQSELGRVGEITQQTLKFYRRSTSPMDVRFPDMLRSVLVLHQARMQSPRIEVKLRLSDRAIAFGYPGELRQVFANLMGNALDAMPAGGVLYVRARAARRMGRPGTRITVADTGTGMSEAVRSRIFQPFFTTKEATGTGLGLWVSAETLEKHRAILLVRSRVAKHAGDAGGTVFSIFFPQDGVPRGPVRVISAAQALADHIL